MGQDVYVTLSKTREQAMQHKVAGENVSPVIMDPVPVVTPSSLLPSFPVGEKKELGRQVTLPGSWLRG